MKTTKKVTSKKREVLNVVLGSKLPIEVKATLNALSEEFQTQTVLFGKFLTELKKLGSNSNSNLETRFNRSIYRNVESGLTRKSIQGIKFNISAQTSGVKIVSKYPIEFLANSNANLQTVRENEYKIVYTSKAKKYNVRKEFKVSEAIEKRVNKFRELIK